MKVIVNVGNNTYVFDGAKEIDILENIGVARICTADSVRVFDLVDITRLTEDDYVLFEGDIY